MCRKRVLSVATANSSSGNCLRRVRVDYAPVNVRSLVILLMSFMVLAVQLPQPTQAAVLRIPPDSWRLESANGVDFAPATDRKQHQQQQHRLLDIIERLLLSLHGTNNDDYEWPDDAVITVPKQQLSSGWRQVDVDRGDVNKRPWLSRLRRTLKRGPGMCINNCLTGGMSFVRCKSMCH